MIRHCWTLFWTTICTHILCLGWSNTLEILNTVCGKDWQYQVGHRMVVPMLPGPCQEELLARCLPFNEGELDKVIKTYWFYYQTFLGPFQHFSQWMPGHPDSNITSCFMTKMRQGRHIFDCLVQIAKYLHVHPDIPLCYSKRTQSSMSMEVNTITTLGNEEWLSWLSTPPCGCGGRFDSRILHPM